VRDGPSLLSFPCLHSCITTGGDGAPPGSVLAWAGAQWERGNSFGGRGKAASVRRQGRLLMLARLVLSLGGGQRRMAGAITETTGPRGFGGGREDFGFDSDGAGGGGVKRVTYDRTGRAGHPPNLLFKVIYRGRSSGRGAPAGEHIRPRIHVRHEKKQRYMGKDKDFPPFFRVVSWSGVSLKGPATDSRDRFHRGE